MIYLDHAAATPVSEKVLKAMTPFMTKNFFNPSSPYLPAVRVRAAYEEAKNQIANFIGAKGNDIVITSGATEANALAFTAVSRPEANLLERGANLRKNNGSTPVTVSLPNGQSVNLYYTSDPEKAYDDGYRTGPAGDGSGDRRVQLFH